MSQGFLWIKFGVLLLAAIVGAAMFTLSPVMATCQMVLCTAMSVLYLYKIVELRKEGK